MFVRSKIDTRNKHWYVQLVESYRENGCMKQRVVRHIGTATSSDEVARLKNIAEAVKAEIKLHELKQVEESADSAFAKYVCETMHVPKQTKVVLADMQVCENIVIGIHDVYGFIYELIGFKNLFTVRKKKKVAGILMEMVLARIAYPASKKASVEILGEQFGVQLKLEQIYRMMDMLDESFYERIQEKALASALKLTNGKLKVLFYDATTLYFESFSEDDLKQNGYSKDMKFNQPQILLTLFVTEHGLPIGYEVFPGATFEGHTLIPVLEKLKTRYQIDNVIFVADRGMLSKQNLAYLDKNKFNYIVGARIKSFNKNQQQMILDWVNKIDKNQKEITHRIDIQDNQHLILSYRPCRAQKDKIDREKAIQKLQARLKRSANPKQLIARYGFHKFIFLKGEAELCIDEDKLKTEAQWDGVTGIITNYSKLENNAALDQYRNLWQVEESFRITKHDLRIRPIYHWTPKRIRAHVAIAFMAFVCVRYLEHRTASQYQKLSPEQIRKSLIQTQAVIVKDLRLNKQYLFPMVLDEHAQRIYKMLGINILQRPVRIKAK